MENPVDRAVLAATSEQLQMPDQKLMKDVADLINTRSDIPKLAVQAIGKRLMLLRNAKVQALTLELIEYCAFTCEISFYTQISSNDFLQRLNTLLNPNMNPQMQQRLLQVLFVLKMLMQAHQDIFPAYFQFLQKVQTRTPLPANYESRYAVLRKAPTYQAKTATGSAVPVGDTSKNAKLKRDLETVKSNINLTNEIIDNADPNDDAGKNDILTDMIKTLKGVEDKLRNLITNMGGNDESMMSYCLELNDDLVKTFERFETLKKHRKPAPLKVEKFAFTQPPQQQVQVAQNPIPGWGNPTIQQQQPQPNIPAPQLPQFAQPVQAEKPKPPPQIDLLNLFEDEQPSQIQKQQPQPDLIQQQQPKPQSSMPNLFDLEFEDHSTPVVKQQSNPIEQQQPNLTNLIYQQYPPQQQQQQQFPPQQQQFPPQQQQQQFPPQQQQYQQQQYQQQQYSQQQQNQFPPQQFQGQQFQQPQQPNYPQQSNIQQAFSTIIPNNQYAQQQQQQPNMYQNNQRYSALQQPIQQQQGYQGSYQQPNFYPQQPTGPTPQVYVQPKSVESGFDDILSMATTSGQAKPKPQASQPTDLF